MSNKKPLPKFASEAEEARWYLDHQDELDDYFEPIPEGEVEGILANLPPKEAALAQARAATEKYASKSKATSIRLSDEDIEAAKLIAKRQGMRYQTWMKAVLHQVIEREKATL
jgi:uncharacterized protein (DUF4415 family)